MKGAPWYVPTTYLLYVLALDGGIFGVTAWAVFIKGWSAWSFLPALLLTGCGFQPHKWRRLWMADPNEATE